MRVLIGCEFSGIVRDAFLAAGHDAWSCDLLPSESPGPHIQGNVLAVINQGWDLAIFHPPCQYLTYAANHVWNAPGRKVKRDQAFEFFMKLYNSPIEKVCCENPFGYPWAAFRKPDQVIHPWFFADPHYKRTCFWLRNLKPLYWSRQRGFWHEQTAVTPPKPVYIRPDGKPIYSIEAIGSGHNPESRRHARSRFFPGVAAAMAEQWGS
jgi:hypothetical protein